VRILAWYAARRFFKPFLFGVGLFSVLSFLGVTIEKLNSLLHSDASITVLLEYLWLGVPRWTIQMLPAATLLATLVAISGLVRSGEWLAVQASGIQPLAFWRPLLGCSLVVTGLGYFAQERVSPYCSRSIQEVWQDRIHPDWDWGRYSRVALAGGPNQFLQASAFHLKEGRLERVILDTMGAGGLERQLDAQTALWDPAAGRWTFYDGVERRFDAAGAREESFDRKESGLAVAPADLVPRTADPDEMNPRDIRGYVERAGGMEFAPIAFQIGVHTKRAYPFANFILCALGIPIALMLRRSSLVVNLCAALAVFALYMWLMQVGKIIGAGGAVSPALAAWFANLIFGTLALGLLWRYEA